ncbi:MAG TPA: YaiI/YqxD family protein [Fibrobacteria bacterium]|jgi:uncharacterized protein YaiI (UPF0178 family)|nr:YaiI/YqxD family protein [Fibrobacteria bacterium]
MTTIYVDADACPVKDEVYRVAARHAVPVIVVANAPMRMPQGAEAALVRLEVVGQAFDAADDWIAERAREGDIVVTSDILLAGRCINVGSGTGAFVLAPNGKPFTEDNIGTAAATRELMADLRAMGEVRGGPPPFSKKDRGVFLQELEKMVVKAKRSQGRGYNNPT